MQICLKNYAVQMPLCDSHVGDVSTNQDEEFTDYEVLYCPEEFDGNLTLTALGAITITTTSDLRIGETYAIGLSAQLNSQPYIAHIKVEIVSQCIGVTCPSGEVCDECTGNCVEQTTDLQANIGGLSVEGQLPDLSIEIQ